MGLGDYKRKRKFDKTPEPSGTKGTKTAGKLKFVIQKHQASHLHYDFRLEMEGVLKSWAVPKGPSLNPADKRLAMMTEDHPMDYRTFEGIIPPGNYGAGTVMVWDEGTYEAIDASDPDEAEKALRRGLYKGHLSFRLFGKKLGGEWSLIKMKERGEKSWLLIKKEDEFVSDEDVREQDRSAVTGRTLDEIRAGKRGRQRVWLSHRKTGRTRSEGLSRAGGTATAEPPEKIKELDAAPKGPVPKDVSPMLATLVDEAFDRPGWIFEIKWDGYRAIGEKVKDRVHLYSRNRLSFIDSFAPVVEAVGTIEHDVVLDGEVVVLDSEGRSSFQTLQNYQKTGSGNIVYCVFDLLWINGRDIRTWPLLRRKDLLSKILPANPRLKFSEHIEEKGEAFLKAATAQRLEGIIAKDGESPYREGVRGREWQKIKTVQQQEAVIAGFTEPRGGRKYLGALLLGVYEHGELTYIGHSGGGFSHQGLREMRQRLDPLEQKHCPFKKAPKANAPVHWVRPKLVCEVSFQEWTEDGHMRMPIFLGLRADKEPREVKRELPASAASVNKEEPVTAAPTTEKVHVDRREEKYFGSAPPKQSDVKDVTVGGHTVRISHPKKVYWPEERYTKMDLVEYYRSVARWMLPYLKDRPESLHRHPEGIEGESFYHKNVEQDLPDWITTVNVHSESETRNLRYVVCQNAATLLFMANLGCIEVNPWNSRIGHLDKPDYLVIDLDPVDIPFQNVIETALTTKEVLDEGGITGYCKTSGGRGLHIFIPLGARYNNDQSRSFSEILVHLVHERLPRITSLERSPLKRQKKVYLDFLQNRRGQTLVAPYSVRPKAGAPVSTPLGWNEVKKGLDPKNFTMRTTQKRLDKIGDIWKPVLGKGIDLEKALDRLERARKR